MMDSVTSWIEQAWLVLDSIPGISTEVVQERRRWDAFASLDTVEVVVFGAYDAGKSSLLKRLLVDWHAEVPDWLTVSGRRETFESKRVEALGLGLTDTPGLGSGRSEHDDLALSAMRLADAYLWVLPPQLVTTGKERFLDILFGDGGIAEVTIAVIARMDEAGVDPVDAPSGFMALCSKKKAELSALIGAASSNRKLRSVHCIVADPYQMVGNIPKPEPEKYNVGRAWDGVEKLAEEIRSLAEQRHELRLQAGVRFVRLLLRDVRDELERLKEDLILRKKAIDNEGNRHAISEQRINALERQARAELRRRIEDALLPVYRSVDVGADLIRRLEHALAKVIDDWAEESFTEYRRLVGELELEVRERMFAPSVEGFRRLAQEAEERDTKDKRPKVDPLKIGKRVMKFGPALRKAFETYAAAELGMSIKEAAECLQKLESAGETVEAFIKSQGRRVAFRSAEHATKASQFIKWAKVVDAMGPLVEQLGGMLIEVSDEVMTAKRDEERHQRMCELKDRIRAEAEKLEEEAAADFNATCEGLRRWLLERLKILDSCREDCLKQLQQVEGSLGSIEDLIRSYPG